YASWTAPAQLAERHDLQLAALAAPGVEPLRLETADLRRGDRRLERIEHGGGRAAIEPMLDSPQVVVPPADPKQAFDEIRIEPAADRLRRASSDHAVGGDVAGHDGAGADDRPVADPNASRDVGAMADPHIVTDLGRRIGKGSRLSV